MTFSDEAVGKALSKDFVCAWKNRKDGFHNCDPKVEQGIYERTADAFPTMNIITLFLTPDLQVLHYFSGYFAPGLFLQQVAFAQKSREALFDSDFKARDGGTEAFTKLHAEAGDAIKAEAGKLEAGGDAWKAATEGLCVPGYRGSSHTHSEACLGPLHSVHSYMSIVHGDLAGKKEAEEDLQRYNNYRARNVDNNRGWSSLQRVKRKIEPYPGERRVVEGLKVLSEVEGSYLYGNPFTEE
ncbi:MAG: hypothetical protein FD180_5011 [Planctomycetota bacterium]|nr:MAG: hypothetical protein FD180_5011 [Planctomycetota bacterium]